MKPIGGFFELEVAHGDEVFHANARAFSTARACLRIILQHLSPSKVYIPFYTCNALFEPMVALNIPYEFYSINEQFEPTISPVTENKEMFLYVNYFGLCSHIAKECLHSNASIIIDNTQAFFEKDYPGAWSYNSARKFFGVPDGAYLYSPYQIEMQSPRNTDFHFTHLINRLTGKQQQAFAEYRAYEQSLDTAVTEISLLSERILSNIDYTAIARTRRINFLRYQTAFKSINRLKLALDDTAIPFTYPLLLDHPIDRQRIFDQEIFFPTLWEDTLTRDINGFEYEKMLSKCLLPLPIDQRYDLSDCDRVIDAITQFI